VPDEHSCPGGNRKLEVKNVGSRIGSRTCKIGCWFLFVRSEFRLRLLSTPPRGDPVALGSRFPSPGPQRTFTSSINTMPGTQKGASGTARVGLPFAQHSMNLIGEGLEKVARQRTGVRS
jgi:hypothetical protein